VSYGLRSIPRYPRASSMFTFTTASFVFHEVIGFAVMFGGVALLYIISPASFYESMLYQGCWMSAQTIINLYYVWAMISMAILVDEDDYEGKNEGY